MQEKMLRHGEPCLFHFLASLVKYLLLKTGSCKLIFDTRHAYVS